MFVLPAFDSLGTSDGIVYNKAGVTLLANSTWIVLCIICAFAFAGVVLLKRDELPARLRRFTAIAAIAAVLGATALMFAWFLTASE